jgi:hypothetical protein
MRLLGVYVPVSPASPEKAINDEELSARVLSSVAFRIVTPRIAALEAATMVKSLPVMPRSTSLEDVLACPRSNLVRFHT